jgi:hypothetical protein
MKNRDEQIVNGILSNGFEFKGEKYRPISARSLLFLERVKSPYYVGGDQLRGLLDFLFISSKESREILKAINTDWDEAIMEFADGFSMEDLTELSKIVGEQGDDAASAVVEIREKATDKKK